ncbi:MAG: helix-turn-helix domain-containing protein [Nitrospirota bacterium]|nr:helix-turn-helix domain-containing protein [Nitrospirota bacterium]
MKRKRLTLVEEHFLAQLSPGVEESTWSPSYSQWIKNLRVALRMTQTDLAQRAQVTQPHLAAIESGKVDPQFKTLRRIFDALSCDITITPRPKADIQEVLRDQARRIARKRLQMVVGTMAMEGQVADAEVFEQVLEKRVDDILNDPGERLWDC